MINTTITGLQAKNQNYNTEFRLYPKVRKVPEFTIQPIDGFKQYTWISLQTALGYEYVEIKPTTQVISMVEGTEFSVDSFVIDPSNLLTQVNDDNITYVWRKDGAQLYELNNQNTLRGVRSFYISASDCIREVSGIYQLEAKNAYGSEFSSELEINVINKNNHPFLYKNLIVNPNGTKGLEGWTGDGDFKVDEFSLTSRNHFSIPGEVYKPLRSPYTEQFNFSIYPNEARLSEWFDKTKVASTFDITQSPYGSYHKWLIANYHPTLVDTDEPGYGSWGGFFPSWNYIDRANQNESLYGLDELVDRPKCYFTRDKLKFSKFGGKAKCQAYQDIDVTEAASLIDGETYGINQLILHFFAYIGIGISKYEVEYESATNGNTLDNTIPMKYAQYISGAYAPENIKPTLIPLYALSQIDTEPCYCCPPEGESGPFVYIQNDTVVNIKPVVEDTTDIVIEFYDETSNQIGSKTIKGPTEKDIWAVKEKFFVPYYFGNLYSWMFNATSHEFRVFAQRYTTMDAIRGIDNDEDYDVKDINAQWVQKYHYPLYDPFSNEYRRIEKHDRGAAAMFGINEDVAVPRGTRTIRVNLVFNHRSNVIFDANPRIKGWNAREIYYDYYTNSQANDRLFEYGNPRCGVTTMHLSLHPDTVEVTSSYSTYKIPIGNVWYKQRARLGNGLDEFWSVTQQSENVEDLQYKDVRPDLDIQFGTQQFIGPLSSQIVEQLYAQLGLEIGAINIVPVAAVGVTPPTISQLGTKANYPVTLITISPQSTQPWTNYAWQVKYDGTWMTLLNGRNNAYTTPTLAELQNNLGLKLLLEAQDGIRLLLSQDGQNYIPTNTYTLV